MMSITSAKKKWFYIQVRYPHGDAGMIAGYTDNELLAKMFYRSMLNNTILLDAFSGIEALRKELVFIVFEGSLTEFSNMVRETYQKSLTGEDIITSFTTNKLSSFALPEITIVTTCYEVFSDVGFAGYAPRFLLPNDVMELHKSLKCIVDVISRMVDDDMGMSLAYDIFNMTTTIYDSKICLAIDYTIGNVNCIDDVVDIIRYGVMKGWYTPT